MPLAEAGHRVVGVDRDRAMLLRARRRAERAPAGSDVADRLTWLEADLVDVDHRWGSVAAAGTPGGPGAFGLAILAVGTILLLPGSARQQSAVATMARLLAPGGVAVIDAWVVGPEERAAYDGSSSLEWVRHDPETGAIVTKRATGRHEPGSDRLTLTTHFHEARPGEPPTHWSRTDELQLVEPAELLGLIAGAGLEIEAVGGDPDMTAPTPDADRVVIVALRPRRR